MWATDFWATDFWATGFWAGASVLVGVWPLTHQGRGAGATPDMPPVSIQGTVGNDHALQRSNQGRDSGADVT